MHKTIFAILIACAALAFSAPAAAATEHCDDHNGHPGKVEGANNDVVLAAGTVFCVKGSTEATGTLVADGTTSLFDYLGNGHDVSYYIVYETPTPTTEPPDTTVPDTTIPPTTVPDTTPDTTTPDTTVTETTVIAPGGGTTPPPTAAPTLPETGAGSWLIAALATWLILTGTFTYALAKVAGSSDDAMGIPRG
jgi:uncharacterized membrane protein